MMPSEVHLMCTDKVVFAVIFPALLTDSVFGKDPPLPPPDPERGSVGLTVNVPIPVYGCPAAKHLKLRLLD